MNEIQKIEVWGETEIAKLFKETPAIIKKYGPEVISVLNTIKKAVTSPEGVAIESIIATIIPGNWEATVISDITRAITLAVPELVTLTNSKGTVLDDASQLVTYVKGLNPKWQNAGFFKLASLLFSKLDPSLNEVAADTAAQVAYATSTTS